MKEPMKLPFVRGTFILFLLVIFSSMFVTLLIEIFEKTVPFSEYAQQFIGQIGTWLIPGLLFAYFFYDKFWDDLKVKHLGKLSNYGWFILIAMVCYPLAVYLQKINEAMTLPESMVAIEQFLRNMEQKAQEVMLRLLSGTSSVDLMFALLNMALLPAVCEEVFFRGVVLNNLVKRTSRIHLSVWLSAILFSFVHLQFFGFLPRVIHGALFGYAFVFSKSLWVPILLHFLNNASITVMYYFYQKKWVTENPLTWDVETATLWMAVLSLAASVSLLWFIFYRRNKARSNFE